MPKIAAENNNALLLVESKRILAQSARMLMVTLDLQMRFERINNNPNFNDAQKKRLSENLRISITRNFLVLKKTISDFSHLIQKRLPTIQSPRQRSQLADIQEKLINLEKRVISQHALTNLKKPDVQLGKRLTETNTSSAAKDAELTNKFKEVFGREPADVTEKPRGPRR